MAWTRVVCGRLGKSDYKIFLQKPYIKFSMAGANRTAGGRNRKSKKQHMEFWMPEHFSQTVVSQDLYDPLTVPVEI